MLIKVKPTELSIKMESLTPVEYVALTEIGGLACEIMETKGVELVHSSKSTLTITANKDVLYEIIVKIARDFDIEII